MDFIIDNYPEYNFSIRLKSDIKNLEKFKEIEKNENVIVLNPKYVKVLIFRFLRCFKSN
jgi:hypothetical protein